MEAAEAGAGAATARGEGLGAEAFRAAYPEEYLRRFISRGLRPDGRPLGGGRPASVHPGAARGADASALVRLGGTMVLAGACLELTAAADANVGADGAGVGAGAGEALRVAVELAPLRPQELRGARAAQAEGALEGRLSGVLGGGTAFDLGQLAALPGVARWAVALTVYVLSDDGSVLDACLLAAVAALTDLRLPTVEVSEGTSLEDLKAAFSKGGRPGFGEPERRLELHRVPLALTFGAFGEHLLADPTAEEEALASSLTTVVTDGEGELVGTFRAASGGRVGGRGEAGGLDTATLQGFVQAARKRHVELLAVLGGTK